MKATKWQVTHPLQWRTYLANRSKKHWQIILAAKQKPCADCGNSFFACQMDFDRVRGKKRYNLSAMASKSLKTIREEIAKCDVVCANCHRLRTYERGEYRDYVKAIS